VHEVGEPHGDAIDENKAILFIGGQQCGREIESGFADRPVPSTSGAMRADALTHLIIDHFGCRDVCALLSLLGELLGVTAFARARAAKDECDPAHGSSTGIHAVKRGTSARFRTGPNSAARPDNDGAHAVGLSARRLLLSLPQMRDDRPPVNAPEPS